MNQRQHVSEQRILETAHRAQASCVALGSLFRYPDERHLKQAQLALLLLRASAPDAAEYLEAFLSLCEEWSLSDLREEYTRVFDLGPRCTPYISIHLFGPESPQRAALMAGLAETIGDLSSNEDRELPDHIGVILRAAPLFSPLMWAELSFHALRPALKKMIDAIDDDPRSPWWFALNAVDVSLKTIDDLEVFNSGDAPGESAACSEEPCHA